MKPTSKRALQAPRLPKNLSSEMPAALETHGEHLAIAWHNASLTQQTASHVVWEQASLRRVTLGQSRLPHARFTDVRLEACDFSGANLEHAHLRRTELRGCRLLGTQFIDARLEDVLLYEGNAEGVVFARATFKLARFENCRLTQASFEGADLTDVVFSGCDLTQANFLGAKLSGADLRGSVINQLLVGMRELQGAIIEPAQAVQMAGLLGLVVKEPGEPLDL